VKGTMSATLANSAMAGEATLHVGARNSSQRCLPCAKREFDLICGDCAQLGIHEHDRPGCSRLHALCRVFTDRLRIYIAGRDN